MVRKMDRFHGYWCTYFTQKKLVDDYIEGGEYLFSLMVPPMEKTRSLSWELLVLWSVESVFTRPESEAMARESPKLAQINSPCLIRTTQAVEPVNSVALP